MVEFIILVSVGLFGFILGWTSRERHAERKLNAILNDVQESVRENVQKNLIPVEIEQHEGHYYVYNMKDKTFMAQGNTRQELERVLEEKFPGKKFAATEDNLVKVGFQNANNQ